MGIFTKQSNEKIIQSEALPFETESECFTHIRELVREKSFVLLGEATHGTHEFYATRAEISRRLIQEEGFDAIAVEADWPDAYRVKRYIRKRTTDANPDQALGDFERFPRWMWRNTDFVDLVAWLHAFNDSKTPREQAGFYGMDLYSLHGSMDAVVQYLDQVDPLAAKRARERYGCFEEFGEEPQEYGYHTAHGISEGCEREVVQQLIDLQRKRNDYMSRDGLIAEEELFSAEQNAIVARNAEAYYRSMYRGGVSTWNLRDSHMVETLVSLSKHLRRQRGKAKIIVWAHNSHLGDARATEMGSGRRREHNVGQLIREQFGDDAALIGFTTSTGTVSAASDWGGAVERKHLRPPRDDSVEGLFSRTKIPRFVVKLRRNEKMRMMLSEPLLERAIGVIYRPETERLSHYFTAKVSEQFDAIVHFEQSFALIPLEKNPVWEKGELPETFPFGV